MLGGALFGARDASLVGSVFGAAWQILFEVMGKMEEQDQKLLEKFLTPKQMRQYEAERRIVVTGSSGRQFIIPNTYNAEDTYLERCTVVYSKTGEYLEHWCVQNSFEALSGCQHVLALKFYLEQDDEKMEEIARGNLVVDGIITDPVSHIFHAGGPRVQGGTEYNKGYTISGRGCTQEYLEQMPRALKHLKKIGEGDASG